MKVLRGGVDDLVKFWSTVVKIYTKRTNRALTSTHLHVLAFLI